MLVQANTPEFNDLEYYDVIVVGAGAVGIPLAITLARNGKKVALLEAGPMKPSQSSQKYFEAAKSSGHNLEGLHVGRFRCLGGTTHFWGGQLVPFAPIVFEDRDWIAASGWPLDYNDIEPFFQETFNILGMSHVERDDQKVWEKIGVPAPPTTEAIQPIFTRWTPESNLTIHFANDIENTPNLTVVTMAQVGALITDETDDVTGVELRFESGPAKKVHANKVVLANGTIEISRLLQLPVSGGKAAPWHMNQWIGKGFYDHVDTYCASVAPIDKHRFMDVFENAIIDGIKYNPKLRLADEVQRNEKLLEVSSHFVFNSSFSDNIANLKILIKGVMRGRLDKSRLRNPLELLSTLRFIVPMALRYIRYRRIMNLTDGGIQLRLTCEQTPLSSSQIKLRKERDAFDMPLVDVHWDIGPEVVKTLSTCAEYIRDYLKDTGLAEVTIDQRLLNRDPTYLALTDDANHQLGGAKMGRNAQEGVVDSNCKVFGTNNLYIAGAAVFPTSGFANPTFTAIALGLRLAQHLGSREMECVDRETS
ncbi:GMC oxidoreductase [Celeribacter halophilus]|uniref:GMC oxidoreductase n=1 Tax=Celeribacter halophilus TaxID=576117 RepID=UPI003A909704